MDFKWNADFNVIFAASASGKTTMAKKYDNVIDLIGGAYKFLDFDLANDELQKGRFCQLNPNYPNNYIDAIIQAAKDKNKLLLLPLNKSAHDGFVPELHKRGLRFAIAFRTDLQEVEEIMRSRGNNDDFMKKVLGNYESNIASIVKLSEAVIVIPKGQHLEDALVEYMNSGMGKLAAE